MNILHLGHNSSIKIGFYLTLFLTTISILFYMLTKTQNEMVKELIMMMNSAAWPTNLGRHYVDRNK